MAETVSVQAFVVETLMDADHPMTTKELWEAGAAKNLGFAYKSPGVAASQLYAMGIVSRNKLNGVGGGRHYAYYLPEGWLDRLPADFSWRGKPQAYNDAPKVRNKLFIEPSAIAGHHDGEDLTVERAHAALEAAEAPPTWFPGEPRRTIVWPPDRDDQLAVQEPERGPSVLLHTAKGLRRMTVREAKDLYRQLREVFE